MPTPINPNNKTNRKGVNTVHEQPLDDAVFRRKEDQIKYDITNKIISVVKWLIAFNLVLLYFFYSVTKDNKTLVEYQMKMISDISQKVGKTYMNSAENNGRTNSNNSINTKIFDTSQNANKCASCHNNDRNAMFVPSMWAFEDFRKYVRGEIRIPSNGIMPLFNKTEINDKELEAIFYELTKK